MLYFLRIYSLRLAVLGLMLMTQYALRGSVGTGLVTLQKNLTAMAAQMPTRGALPKVEFDELQEKIKAVMTQKIAKDQESGLSPADITIDPKEVQTLRNTLRDAGKDFYRDDQLHIGRLKDASLDQIQTFLKSATSLFYLEWTQLYQLMKIFTPPGSPHYARKMQEIDSHITAFTKFFASFFVTGDAKKEAIAAYKASFELVAQWIPKRSKSAEIIEQVEQDPSILFWVNFFPIFSIDLLPLAMKTFDPTGDVERSISRGNINSEPLSVYLGRQAGIANEIAWKIGLKKEK